MPSQFTNKLMEKAQNIEVQRMQRSPPRKLQNSSYEDTKVILNQPEGWFDGRSQAKSPTMMQTWKPAEANIPGSAEQNRSPNRMMMQSLVSASQFQVPDSSAKQDAYDPAAIK
jgi:hypothetical protein